MKKVIHFFKKKKRVVEISSTVASDAVPHPPRNIPHYVSRPSELYKNFHIDYCGEGNNESTCTIQNGTSDETLHLNGYDENVNNGVAQASEVEETTRPLENDLTRDFGELPVIYLTPASGTVSDSDSNELHTTNDLNIPSAESRSDRSSPSNNMSLKELNDAIQKLSNDLAAKNGSTDRKNSGNTYLITISNSAHFHIGSQKTINYPDVDKNIKKKDQLELTEIKNSELLSVNDGQALDIKDALSEEDMLQISLSVHEKWEDFARNLGVDESTIRELEYLNDNDYNFIVYDILHQYLSRYPNTSVGYMIDVLKRSNETYAIQRLLKNR